MSGVAVVLATHRPEEVPALSWRSVHVRGQMVEPPDPGEARAADITLLSLPERHL
ncbi:hypothetical protein ACFSC4_00640 [Deinococcus malanensis]|uniref:hypothetical protein n=1 Tax=Deinococcus malanensis TaxID=1706855 RepID=UPI00362BCAAA